MSKIQWDVAEVLGYDYTYQYVPPSNSNPGNTDQLFALKVSTLGDYLKRDVLLVRPSNMSLKQIPLIGEIVLIYKTINEHTTDMTYREGWYYLAGIDLQSSINENRLPGVSQRLSAEQVEQIPAGLTFKSKTISPLQPYEGDTIQEGRWGQSIRLGSSISSYPTTGFEKPQTSNGYYHKLATWSTIGPLQTSNDPIIVLSNGRKNLPSKEFVVEDVEQDASSLYLTSTQKLDKLKLTKQLTVHNGDFIGSQFVGVADRVILRAKRDIAVIDSEDGIILSTPNEIYIGGEDATEPLTHGLILQEILQLIVQAIAAGSTGPGGAPCVTNAAELLSQISTLLPDLNSTKYKITKT
jgi:hypothetical protein